MHPAHHGRWKNWLHRHDQFGNDESLHRASRTPEPCVESCRDREDLSFASRGVSSSWTDSDDGRWTSISPAHREPLYRFRASTMSGSGNTAMVGDLYTLVGGSRVRSGIVLSTTLGGASTQASLPFRALRTGFGAREQIRWIRFLILQSSAVSPSLKSGSRRRCMGGGQCGRVWRWAGSAWDPSTIRVDGHPLPRNLVPKQRARLLRGVPERAARSGPGAIHLSVRNGRAGHHEAWVD